MIKRSPTDFQVEEHLRPDAFSQPAEGEPQRFLLCKLTKQSLSTPEAVARAARTLSLKSGAIAYAGLKDKHAHTIQHVTVKLDATSAAPKKTEGDGWSLDPIREVPRPIQSSDIDRNAFTIVARNLTEEGCFDMDQAASMLAPPLQQPTEPGIHKLQKQLLLVNYFGDQRFGSARHGQGFLAKFLIKGDFESALKLAIATEARKDRMQDKIFKRTLLENWGKFGEVLPKLRPCPERRAVERLANSSRDFRAAFCALPYLVQQLSVYAYQSYLWNSIASRTIVNECSEQGDILAVDDPFGEMLFPEAEGVSPELEALNIPLLARKTQFVDPWKQPAEDVLEEEGIELSELQIPGVRRPFFGEEPRALFFKAEDFSMSKPERDETAANPKRRKRTLSFKLPKGCYATVVLRAMGQ